MDRIPAEINEMLSDDNAEFGPLTQTQFCLNSPGSSQNTVEAQVVNDNPKLNIGNKTAQLSNPDVVDAARLLESSPDSRTVVRVGKKEAIHRNLNHLLQLLP